MTELDKLFGVDRPCPYCGAEPGKPCRIYGSGKKRPPHQSRNTNQSKTERQDP